MEKTTEIDSLLFASMLRQGAVALGKERTVVNDLNVFPVPDGDTGDNMYMTLKAGCKAINGDLGTLSEIAAASSSGMLLGARGNSGVILSRIFAGLAKGLQGLIVADVKSFSLAMETAVKEAYKAVPVPVEGTIITVLREGVLDADTGDDFNRYFDTLLEAMQVSLDHTPELLQVLKDAGVVDSGGAGLLCVFRGMNDALHGLLTQEENTPAPLIVPDIDLSKFDENSTLEFGYCTEFLLRLTRAKVNLDTFDEQVIFDYLNQVGQSVVAFREGSIVKVHVHTFTPGEILNHCQQYGEFLTLKIENMSLQHHQLDPEHGKREMGNSPRSTFHVPLKPYGVVTVASGKGLMEAFKEIGADEVIAGGQTMNPSTQDFLDAFKCVNARHILVFPNNPNIKMAADQAAGLYDAADVRVMPSVTIGEGYYGIASFDRANDDVEAVVASLAEVMQSVVTGMVATAIRDAKGHEVAVHCGDYVGYCGKQILSDAPDRIQAAKELCKLLGCASRDVMLVFQGEDVPKEEAERLVADLGETYKNLEIMLNYGGQPVYDYIFVLC